MKVEWNGKRLTKKRALFLCWKLWEWLAGTGSGDKEEWPEWEDNGGEVAICIHSCPCCEQSNVDCDKCPLLECWGGADVETNSHYCKKNDTSPYRLWGEVTCPTRKKYARIIADFAKKEYEKLEKK